MPAPNVDSCVIRFDIKEHTPEGVSDEKHFFRVVRAAFSQRRKTLVNSVSSAIGIDKATVSDAVTKAGMPLTIRPEQMSMENFIAFSECLKELI